MIFERVDYVNLQLYSYRCYFARLVSASRLILEYKILYAIKNGKFMYVDARITAASLIAARTAYTIVSTHERVIEISL